MRRTLIPVLAVLITLCQPAPADAMWWAWLEKWSGPGPFKAKPFRTFLFTACVQDVPAEPRASKSIDDVVRWEKSWSFEPSPIARSNTFHKMQDAIAGLLSGKPEGGPEKDNFYRRLLENPYNPTLHYAVTSRSVSPDAPRVQALAESAQPSSAPAAQIVASIYGPQANTGGGHNHERMICGYFDIGSFESEGDQDPERGFPPLTARMYDFGPSARIHDGIDIGAGVGWVQFSGSGVDRRQGAFTPLRVIIRPVLLALPDRMRREWMGIFSFYWKETYVWGRMTGADFGAPQSDWVEDGEMIRSFGINLDLTALLPLALKRD